MAFFDWNHDGKKDYVDNAIEMMIIDDIEEEEAKNGNSTPEWGAGYSGKQAYTQSRQVSQEDSEQLFKALKPVLLIFGAILAAIVLVINILNIFNGYASWIGIIVSAVVLRGIIRSWAKNRK